MILFTTIDNIILDGRIHFPFGLKIEQYEYSPLSTTLKHDLLRALGGYYMLNLKRENRVIVYREYNSEQDIENLYADVTYITYLFSFAWFLKYNTFQIGEVYFFDATKRQVRKLAESLSVTIPTSIKGKATPFTISDAQACINLVDSFLSFNFPTKFEINLGTTNYSKLSVLQRAVEMIELSKVAPNIHHKIGLLCSTLECLFTTDKSEITHKVCERVAFFLSEIPKDRIETFQQVKKAYSHRSDFFHGNKLRNVSDEVYFNIDNIVRKVMFKAITEKDNIFSSSNESLNQHFTELIFGASNLKTLG